MSNNGNRVCPVERAGGLDNNLRKWVQNPLKILSPYVKEGMTALDLGCGPGFFSIELAHLVGATGRVIASDWQTGMLELLKNKIHRTDLEKRITLHQCAETSIGVSEKVDFALAFYMVHEVPDQDKFFAEIKSILKPGGKMLMAEPSFHVSETAFAESLKKARNAGFIPAKRPKIFFSRAVVLV